MPTDVRAADLVVLNGVVRTLDTKGTVAQSLAIKAGVIVGVGTTSEISELKDERTVVVDARGRTVLPGFIDGHVHFNTGALESAYVIDLLSLAPRTLEDVLAAVRQQTTEIPAGEWVRADNLNPDSLTSYGLPTRQELDDAAPDHPAVVYTIGFHMATANTRALAEAGIDRDTLDPAGGKIDRDAAGELTGVLRERGKLRLDPRRADTVLPRFDFQARCDALRARFSYLHQLGVTSIHDMVVDPEEIRAYQALRAAGELPTRVQLIVRGVESQISTEEIVAVGLQPGFGDQWLKFGGVKLSIDGICVAKNAAVYDAYPGEDENYGVIRIDEAELSEKVSLCHRYGLRVAIHAIGPRAVDMALDAIEEALATSPRSGHRHRIEHAYLSIAERQIARMAQLGVVVSTQPAFLHGIGDGWIRIWGSAGLSGTMPLRSMLEHGIPLMGSTDYPCVPADPLLGIATAVTRKTRSGNVVGRDEALGIEDALRLQTTGAAFGGFEEHLKGSLELGKLGDFVVLSEDPIEVPVTELHRLKVETTAVGGKVVLDTSSDTASAVPHA